MASIEDFNKENDMTNVIQVFNDNGKLYTTSRVIAEVLGREHRDVIRQIKNLNCSDNFRLRNFTQTYYSDSQGKKQPMYNITKDGATFLVMKSTGEKAGRFTEAILKRFNEMEEQIKSGHLSLSRETRQQTIYDVLKFIKPSRRVGNLTAPPKKVRRQLNVLIAEYSKFSKIFPQMLYSDLYKEFKIQKGFDLKQRAKKDKKKNPLDIAEDINVIDELYAVAFEMFEIKKEVACM